MGDRKILVNTSVGPTFEVDALKKWLGTCKHSYYLCDATGMGVARDALKDIPNVLYTPYISGKSIQSVERLSQKALAISGLFFQKLLKFKQLVAVLCRFDKVQLLGGFLHQLAGLFDALLQLAL